MVYYFQLMNTIPLSAIPYRGKFRIRDEIFIKIAQIHTRQGAFNACLIEGEHVSLVYYSSATSVLAVAIPITKLIPLWGYKNDNVSILALPKGMYHDMDGTPLTGIILRGYGGIASLPLILKSQPRDVHDSYSWVSEVLYK